MMLEAGEGGEEEDGVKEGKIGEEVMWGEVGAREVVEGEGDEVMENFLQREPKVERRE